MTISTLKEPDEVSAELAGRIVFICGLHKSGTTLLKNILGSHPDISAHSNTGVPADEGQHLQTAYSSDNEFGGPGRFGLDEGSHLTEESCLVRDDCRRQILREWARYWDHRKRVLVEKSPINLVRTRFLQALFPSSKMIIIKRHPVVVSMATQKMCRWPFKPFRFAPLVYLFSHWAVTYERWRTDMPYITDWIEVSYEDLVSHPKVEMASVARFLGVSSDGFDVGGIRGNVNEGYLEKWRKSEESTFRGQYVRYLRSKFAPRFYPFGYNLGHI